MNFDDPCDVCPYWETDECPLCNGGFLEDCDYYFLEV